MKLPFTFATRFLFRLFLPGLLFALACMPVTETVAGALQLGIDDGVRLLLSAVALGWFVSILDQPIYWLFEGRRFWPRWLRHLFLKGEKARLRRLRHKRCEAVKANDDRRVVELDLQEAQFPLCPQGRPHAVYPTRLGNLVTEYEQYPDRKYNIDGVFYWYRIWLYLDHELRTELDEKQATVDGLLYISFVSYLSGIIFLCYALVCALFDITFFGNIGGWPLLGLALIELASGYVVYRISLPAHAEYGNFFKSTFDCFYSRFDPKHVLEIIADATGEANIKNEKGPAAYRIAWRYLHWHEFRPPHSDKNINFEAARAAAAKKAAQQPSKG